MSDQVLRHLLLGGSLEFASMPVEPEIWVLGAVA